MKFFNKKNKEETAEQYDIIFEDVVSPPPPKINHSPDALTTEEIIGFGQNKSQVINNDSTGALEALKQKLAAVTLDDIIPDKEENGKPEINIEEFEIPTIETVTEPETQVESEPKPEVIKPESLLDKCKPYIVDENGSDTTLNSEPLYKLQSVADILKSDSEKILEKLSQNYDVSFEISETAIKETTETEKITATKTEPEEKEVFEEKIKVSSQNENPPQKVISDIDYVFIPETKKEPLTFEPNATVTFTPVSSGESAESQIKVSTHTKAIDLTNELIKLPETVSESNEEEIRLEQSDFEDFVPKTEYTSAKDIKKLKRKLSIDKRDAFLTTIFSFFLTALLAFAKLPFMTNILLSHTVVSMIICSSVAGIIILLNADMFSSLGKIFSSKCKPDISAVLASITASIYAVMGIIKGEIILDILLLFGIVLSFRSLSKFFKASYILSNFSQISSSAQKKAVKLINDPAITFSMVKNSIEGDVLIAAAQKTEHISDFMKYATYGSFFGGRMPIITVISVLISIISAFAGAAYFDGVFYGMYAATAIQLLTALPTVFLIDTLPLYRASKKLNKMGAMIMGKIGAEHLEMANAVVLSSNDLFPNGTVTLHQMKVLSENTLDDTLLRAASLTEYMSSTLAPIFKQIVTGSDYSALPDTDTVKYEDRMGISGWVDNRLLFIGNRALMEAHGIEVPSLEVDRKILRQGYFPVYVATSEKACALLVIQYRVDQKISHELRTLTKIGVTLLINNTDPNLSESMICDYLGLYDDSVKVMSAAGCHMYKNTVSPTTDTSAPAAYKGSSLALAVIMNCATKIKRSNNILTVLYIISAVLGAMLFAYTSFGGSGSLLSGASLLIYGLATTFISYFIYLTERP